MKYPYVLNQDYNSEGPLQVGGMNQQEPHEVQQKCMPDSALGMEQHCIGWTMTSQAEALLNRNSKS